MELFLCPGPGLSQYRFANRVFRLLVVAEGTDAIRKSGSSDS